MRAGIPGGRHRGSCIPHASAPIGANAVGAATIAHPGVYALIFYDRILSVQQYGTPVYSVLGKVMAHEITHLLLGDCWIVK
jgi:hypothetical protein